MVWSPGVSISVDERGNKGVNRGRLGLYFSSWYFSTVLGHIWKGVSVGHVHLTVKVAVDICPVGSIDFRWIMVGIPRGSIIERWVPSKKGMNLDHFPCRAPPWAFYDLPRWFSSGIFWLRAHCNAPGTWMPNGKRQATLLAECTIFIYHRTLEIFDYKRTVSRNEWEGRYVLVKASSAGAERWSRPRCPELVAGSGSVWKW